MPKLPSLPALFAAGVLSTAALTAQRAPLPGLPMVPPPAPHPGLLAQPLIDNGTPAAAAVPGGPAGPGGQPKVDPATRGVKAMGKDLKKAVAKVKELAWHKRIDDAKAEAERTGKPILWLSTLGDLTGFA